MKRIILNIGQIAISKEPAVLETILGSCVAVCLWDKVRRIGGLNHYLLPYGQSADLRSTIYGAASIKEMVERIVKAGAHVCDLQGQIFGGGSMMSALDEIFNIGEDNVRVAREKLKEYGIPIVGEHIRAVHGIRVVFKTQTGEIMIVPLVERSSLTVKAENKALLQIEKPCRTCIMCGSCRQTKESRRHKKQ